MTYAPRWSDLPLGKRPDGRWALRARFVIADMPQGRRLIENGEVVIECDRVVWVGQNFEGEVSARYDMGEALIGPGFVDLDALSDLDTTVLGMDNQPGWQKGRVWPTDYAARAYEMYAPEELAFQKRYAFAQLLLNGITSALPIASLFYRAWGETVAEFEAGAEAAEDLGLRVWLGPAFRSGGVILDEAGVMQPIFDEERGLAELVEAASFARRVHGTAGGLISGLLAPDRVETCTEALLRKTFAHAQDMDLPVRLHMAQGDMELQTVRRLHGMTAPEWLDGLGLLSSRLIAPHATVATDADLDRYAANNVTIAHCPLVSGRHGSMLKSFSRLKAMGIRIGMGTDTAPPDMVLNMATGLIVNRIAEGRADAGSAADFYDAATIAGADALKRPDLGRLFPGSKADIAIFDMADHMIAPRIDPIQTLVYGATGRVTRATIVDGRLSMRDGAVAGIDLVADRGRAQAQFDGLVARYPERTFGHPPVSEIFPSSYPLYPVVSEVLS
ncbi:MULTISPECIES: amidohydrolase family protein [Rhizobium]|uniref:Amidohydrolase family protein n=1 Tax=Rhizobium tropici TaxID=398 RepID=A0A6P1C9E1_RHITR|nr:MULTISPECIES: amidohydrolase family protein [Rhizobium]AGB75421.1 N-ethylammeline chlorohydrolase [Rhizobium tropici CIAT 899]MBB4241798.1 cytosine/adenosine deaminase-related metal-dependent hydrolase [Rhizobium tropici]MBB5593555.1 cytosine/adenosine deaminase-related metal-dependent hydrolase [Rhizobium tropici]MBB6492123.1 cytosine/adenosine deaminase-related metal-dependent hydrolase [Rhizobium tropici]NEV13800.1 amidohydrolase family protein [Rhizobium tropici]